MKIDIMTLFPEIIDSVMKQSIIGRAQNAGLVSVDAINIRDFSEDKHHRADDSPYGGGFGMVMLADPLFKCHQHLTNGKKVHTILMSPAGKTFNQQKARELLTLDHIILVCGHYEGLDQRFIDTCIDEEISIGDFVLTGGEIPAMAISDAICRMVPGVLSDNACFTEESHWNGLLEYPQYTKPAVWNNLKVPDVLLSGHHANITRWRKKMSLKKTRDIRPDMFKMFEPETKEDKKILLELKHEIDE